MGRRLALLSVSILLILTALACKSGSTQRTISSTKSGSLTVTLSGPGGTLRTGPNDLQLLVSDANGRGVDFHTVALRFRMEAMTGMAEMNDTATLVTTGTPGKYTVKVNLESAGQWEAIVNLQGTGETHEARMPVNVQM